MIITECIDSFMLYLGRKIKDGQRNWKIETNIETERQMWNWKYRFILRKRDGVTTEVKG